jgi:hypothetical protein
VVLEGEALATGLVEPPATGDIAVRPGDEPKTRN